MPDVIVFSGPTLSPQRAAALFPEADCHGPAVRGDVLTACASGPRAICLIDGYFEHRPAVTHKEMLWALEQGIQVFGAASMGALRAAELARFGVQGHGLVFAWFASGELEDEDEVAVAHAAGPDFRAGSEAMVNIRATLNRAVADGIVTRGAAARLTLRAKQTFYAERSYPALLEQAKDELVSDELARLTLWLSSAEHRVNQKQQDALGLLADVRDLLLSDAFRPIRRDWSFPETDAFRALVSDTRSSSLNPRLAFGSDSKTGDVVNEVQLLGPEIYCELLTAAALRLACLTELRSNQVAVPHDSLELSDADFAELERHIQAALPIALSKVKAELGPVLRVLGDYAKVKERALLKQTLSASPSEATTSRGPTVDALARFFRERLARPIPDDLHAFAASVGFASSDELIAAIVAEMSFLDRVSVQRGKHS
ncbi:MAG: TfuA-like protein [Pseudomonadota bacterium]